MNKADIGQAFLNHEAITGVAFEHNAFVEIISGQHAGKAGSLVTVIELMPEPLFIVELESGFDVEVYQSQIKHANP